MHIETTYETFPRTRSQWFPKQASWVSSSSITWERIRNADCQAPAQTSGSETVGVGSCHLCFIYKACLRLRSTEQKQKFGWDPEAIPPFWKYIAAVFQIQLKNIYFYILYMKCLRALYLKA